eukprot:scaffold90349_cov68-Phaeocystis_antarctica.AAC.1
MDRGAVSVHGTHCEGGGGGADGQQAGAKRRDSKHGRARDALSLHRTAGPVRTGPFRIECALKRVNLHLREVEESPSAWQLHPNVLCQLWALAQQRANRIRRRSRLGADRPRVCGVDAIGDCVVRQSGLAAIATVVHGDVGDFGCPAEV